MFNLNLIEKAKLTRRFAYNNLRIKRLESILKGVPLGSVKFANASITDAKIKSLSADKIITGTISIFIGLGEDGKIKIDGEENRILIEDNDEDDRVLLGKNGDDYDLTISKPGFDAKVTTDPLDLCFSSMFNQFKIVLEIDTNISFSGGESGEKSITPVTHGLGYAPVYLAFFLNDDEGKWYAMPNEPEHLSETGNPQYEAICNVDSNYVYASLKKTGAPLNATTNLIKIILMTGEINMT